MWSLVSLFTCFLPFSGGRESGLIEEVEELKSKLMTKTDELNEAIKSNSEVLYM